MKLRDVVLVVLLPVALFGWASVSHADWKVTKVRSSLVDARALTISGGYGQRINGLSFQQEAVMTQGDYQYVVYYDAGRRVCLARRKLPVGDWAVIRLRDYAFKSNDGHNVASMGICPKDGTIHLAFDHHCNSLHYRASGKHAATRPEKVSWDASLFGPVTSELEKGKAVRSLTYPRFWQTPDGGLQFNYRVGGSGSGDRVLVDYNPMTGTWANTRRIDSRRGVYQNGAQKSRSRCSYPNGYTYGPNGKLHTTWVWREGAGSGNHDISYAYSDNRGKTWRNNKGDVVGETGGKLINVNTPGIVVVDVPEKHGMVNTQAQAVDSRGRIHVVMWHCTDESIAAAKVKARSCWGPMEGRRYHHYWRDKNAAWHHIELPGVAGNRPKLFMDKNNNAYLIYNAKQKSDTWKREVYFLKGNLTIMAATADAGWKDWKVIHVEKGPFVNEMLGDRYRWKKDQVLSVMVQDSPGKPHEPTALRIIDFSFDR